MRATEFITERMSTGWVNAWVSASMPQVSAKGVDIEWYSKFFKNLNKGAAFKEWIKVNVKGPVVIRPKLIDDSESRDAVLDAEHLLHEDPVKHEIVCTINIGAKLDNSNLSKFSEKLGARLIHELNHAHQVTQQMTNRSAGEIMDLSNSPFKKRPPAPKKGTNEEHFQYILDNLEQDAWVSEVADDIRNAVGDKSLKVLNGIFQQITQNEYVVIGPKIINIPILHHLYLASKYYGGYLKLGSAGTWQKIKKELYGYLSRY
jgi:hypothetical protein